jgi:hypothetical protein
VRRQRDRRRARVNTTRARSIRPIGSAPPPASEHPALDELALSEVEAPAPAVAPGGVAAVVPASALAVLPVPEVSGAPPPDTPPLVE